MLGMILTLGGREQAADSSVAAQVLARTSEPASGSTSAPPASPRRSRDTAVPSEDLSALGRVLSPGDSPEAPVRCSSRLKALVTPQKEAPAKTLQTTPAAKLRKEASTPPSTAEKTMRPPKVAANAERKEPMPMKRPAAAASSLVPESAALAAKAKTEPKVDARGKAKAAGKPKSPTAAKPKEEEAPVPSKVGAKASETRKRPHSDQDTAVVEAQPPAKKSPRISPNKDPCDEKKHTPLIGRIMSFRDQALTQVPIDSIRCGSVGGTESDAEGVLARPRRNRLQPLQSWRGEKVIYEKGREAVAVQLNRAPQEDASQADVKRPLQLLHGSSPEKGQFEGLSTNALRTYTVCLPAFRSSSKSSQPRMVPLAGTGQDAKAAGGSGTAKAHGVLYVEEGRVRCVHEAASGTSKDIPAGEVVLEKGDAAMLSCRHRVLVAVAANPDAPSARLRWIYVANKVRS
eukprot:TRINITY_DN74181_c0_g1_i1.p1 TRINITY_DN74181_c0_g1~~TRINITY_DN74181_c0_g1_i1.p1  ORF type:complete len:511 (-),score=85.94 TRINITY_DN74181_c0_g1_i1:216-1592(-)